MTEDAFGHEGCLTVPAELEDLGAQGVCGFVLGIGLNGEFGQVAGEA